MMKKIKNLALLSLAFVAISLSSCKKNNTTPDKKTPDTKSTFVATVDGVVTEFNVNLKGWESGTSPNHWLTVIQGNTSDGTTLAISILETAIAGKTYSDADSNDSNRPIIIYQKPTSTVQYYNDHYASNVPSVTVTSVTSTTLDGTFKGRLIKDPATDKADTILITDGKFHISNFVQNP
jgi:Tfp pilus assembly protein PilW